MSERLTESQIQQQLSQLPSWQIKEDKLYRCFEFADFCEAFAFMTRVALKAEAMQHHPEWSNVYNRLEVHLTTHDVGGLSQLDFQMASFLDDLERSY